MSERSAISEASSSESQNQQRQRAKQNKKKKDPRARSDSTMTLGTVLVSRVHRAGDWIRLGFRKGKLVHPHPLNGAAGAGEVPKVQVRVCLDLAPKEAAIHCRAAHLKFSGAPG